MQENPEDFGVINSTQLSGESGRNSIEGLYLYIFRYCYRPGWPQTRHMIENYFQLLILLPLPLAPKCQDHRCQSYSFLPILDSSMHI